MTERVFIDTNILVYSRDEASPFFPSVREALRGLVSADIELCTHRQVLREYVAVVTRPAPKGLGVPLEQTLADVAEFEAFYRILDDPRNVWDIWKTIIKETGITGLRVHDAYLAAVMSGHTVDAILTVNTNDFLRMAAITPIEPQHWKVLVRENT